MKKNLVLLPLMSLLLVGCKDNFEKFNFKVSDSLTIINFADVQIDDPSDLNEGTIVSETIKKCISDLSPNLITFSGDNAYGGKAIKCYRKLCDFMDKFETPYCMVFGNHDREHAAASSLANIVNKSKYGYITKGTAGDASFGNYVIDIKNTENNVIHKLFMMDSRMYYLAKESDIHYVENPVEGMLYDHRNDKPYYGACNYDSIRNKQISWYKNQLSNTSVESTIITHMPILQYSYAYEDYLLATQSSNQTKLEELSPIGECNLSECICSSPVEFGFFDAIKEMNSTKNIIAGHDHINDFSLKYQSVRLSYALKTGNESYWIEDGSRSGCTQIKIDTSGKASISYHYVDLI